MSNIILSLDGAKSIIRKETEHIWQGVRTELSNEYGVSVHPIVENVIDNGFAVLFREINECKTLKELDHVIASWWKMENTQEWFDSRFRRTEE